MGNNSSFSSLAIFSENDEFRESLIRYFSQIHNYSKDRIRESNLLNISFPELSPIDFFIIHLPATYLNSYCHLGLTVLTLLKKTYPDKKAILLCSDKPKQVGFTKKNTIVRQFYLRTPFHIDDLCAIFNNSIRLRDIPILSKPLNLEENNVADTHLYPFANLVGAIQLLIGAVLVGELHLEQAADAIIRSMKDFTNEKNDLTNDNILQINWLIKKISDVPRNTRLALSDYAINKKVLFVDDAKDLGWSTAIKAILFPTNKGCMIDALTPEAGQQLFLKNAGEINSVILDLYFKDKNPRGFNVLNDFREFELNQTSKQLTPVMIFSGSYGATTIIKSLQDQKADAYFCKSINEIGQHENLSPKSKFKQFYLQFKNAFIQCYLIGLLRKWYEDEITIEKRIQEWIYKFPPDSQCIALRLLEKLDFKNTKKIRNLCKQAHQQLIQRIGPEDANKAFYVGLGHSAKSGTHVLYYYRQENFPPKLRKKREEKENIFITSHELPSAAVLHIIDKEKIFYKQRKVILLDDMIGSGNQFTKEFEKILENLPFLEREPFNKQVYYVVLVAFDKGIEEIEKRYPWLKDQLIKVEILDDRHRAVPKNPALNSEEIEEIKNMIYEVSKKKKLYMKNGVHLTLGHNDDAALVAFEHNTPNNTLPIFWSKGANNGWIPLFERKE